MRTLSTHKSEIRRDTLPRAWTSGEARGVVEDQARAWLIDDGVAWSAKTAETLGGG